MIAEAAHAARWRASVLAWSQAVLILVAADARGASLFDPAYRFRTVRTDHFVIYFHQREEAMAARLTTIAEETWQALKAPLGVEPPPLTHVVLVDQTELANGSAFPLPRDTVVVTAVWPAGSDFIGRTDDWLRLVFTHEFTHIAHLDRSESWARVVRGIFGRTPFAFPNLFLPTWQIEGIATYEESAITGQGREHAGDFRAVVDEASRAGRLEPLDRVNGGLTDWPGGLAPYAYGLGFHAYLAERYGADSFAALAAATARRVPYTGSRVFRRIYGRSLGELWRDYEDSIAAKGQPASRDGAEQLTHEGFVASGPRFLPDVCESCPREIVYARRTPHDFPSLDRVTLDGTRPRRLIRRYLGSTAGVGATTIVFDQQELRRNTGLYSDLYALDRASGRIRALTREARLIDPDLSPDGKTIVAVRDRPGQRDLVVVNVHPGSTDIVTLVSEDETQFNAPRWSPDGRLIAVERHRRGAQTDIVLVDPASGRLTPLSTDPSARWVTPTWRPDGRAIVAAADLHEGPFNLYEIDVDGIRSTRQLTHATGGAVWPDVSPDGKTIVYAGYTPGGFDLFRLPYPVEAPSVPREVTPEAVSSVDANSIASGRSQTGPSVAAQAADLGRRARPYSAWSTLAPTSWSPILTSDASQVRVGAAVSGFDVLGYHAYAASATWQVSAPADAPAVNAATPDWQLAYAYARWRPTFWVSASSETSFFAGPPSDAGVPATSTLRERQIEAGVLYPVDHVRVAQTARASMVRALDDFTFPDGQRSLDRTAARLAWSIASAHTYGYSISPEKGVIFGATTEFVRTAFGSFGDASAVVGDLRAYLPGLGPHHVLALRVAGGSASGAREMRRVFLLGGAAPNLDPTDFGTEGISLLRGFESDTFAGSHVALLNAEYRLPLARPERGVGTWPIFFHTIHGALFADAGHTWTRAFDARDLKSSVGGELSLDLVAGYALPLTATIGAAWGHDGSHTVPDRATIYFRIGRAF